MSKVNWNKLGNIVFFILMGVLLFTPLGKPVKVFIHRIIAFSPGVDDREESEQLADYNWVLEDLYGERLYFEELQGQVVFVNFWATWCPPCLAEMPDLQEVYNTYGNQVQFLFVSQEEPEKLQKFLLNKGYDLPVYRPLSKYPEQLYSQSIPATFIIDSEGLIRVSKVGVADWNSEKVATLLDELLAGKATVN